MTNLISRFRERLTRGLRTRFLLLKDAFEVFIGYRHELSPPSRYDYINTGENESIGNEFFHYFIKFGGLQPSDRVLDVGSGFGRMAIPLVEYLSNQGSYEGFDILKDGVNWCRSNFTIKYPNFHFQHSNVYNERYNPNGEYKASQFTFPFKDDSFDFIFLTSVFTHMFPEDIENYLSEIARVLKPQGKCLTTYFVINQSILEELNNNRGTFNFNHKKENFYIEDQSHPEYAVAYDEDYIRKLYKSVNLKIIEPIYYGNWSGRKQYLSFQDIVVIGKE